MSREEFDDACIRADKAIKASNGHQYLTTLKTRCIHCGRSQKVKTRCGGWFRTFIDRLSDEVCKP